MEHASTGTHENDGAPLDSRRARARARFESASPTRARLATHLALLPLLHLFLHVDRPHAVQVGVQLAVVEYLLHLRLQPAHFLVEQLRLQLPATRTPVPTSAA